MRKTNPSTTIRPLRGAIVAALGYFAAAVLGILGLWWASNLHLRSQMRESLIQVASAAAAVVDGDLHRTIASPEQTDGEKYNRCIAPLRQIYARLEGIRYLYTAVLDGDTVRFVLDTAAPGDNDGDGVEDRSEAWSEYEEAEPELLTAIREGRPFADYKPHSDRRGEFISGYAPIHNSNGQAVGIVGADMSADTYEGHRAAARRWALLGLLPAIGLSLSAGAVAYRLRRRAARDAVERNRQAQALRDSQVRFDQVVEQARKVVWETQPDGLYTYVGPVSLSVLGYEPAELIQQKHIGDLHPKPGRAAFQSMIAEIFAARGELRNLEHPAIAKDGRCIWLSTNANPVTDEAGRLVGYRGSSSDITERRVLEDALQENSKRLEHERANLQAIFDASQIGLILVDENAVVVRANNVAARLFGKDADNLQPGGPGNVLGCIHAARTPAGCGHTEACPECPVRLMCQSTLRTRLISPAAEVESHLRIGGEEHRHWLSVSAAAVELDGRPHALLALADITERKRAEDDVRESEIRLKTILDALQAGVVLVDRNTHTIVDANPAALEMFGVPREAVLGAVCHQFICPAECGRCPVTNLGQTVNNSERVVLAAGGHRVPVLKTVVPVTLKGRDYLLESFVDISDRKRAEAELAAHRERLEELVRERTLKLIEAERQVLQGEKLASVGRLAAGVAHEINTPIQYIGDNLRALADFHADIQVLVNRYRELTTLVGDSGAFAEACASIQAAEQKHDLEFILEDAPKAVAQGLEGVQRVASIVRAMKDFSHVKGSEVSAVDLNHCLTSTLTVARNEYKYVADVETDFAELPSIEGYPDELNQVFLNILINAAHAIQDTGNRGKITVSTRPQGDWVEVAIADTGVGIPDDIRRKIYEPFFTTKPPGRGTGQGLAIAHQIIVELHGGRLDCESTVGVGTTFRIRLPLRLTTKPADAEAAI